MSLWQLQIISINCSCNGINMQVRCETEVHDYTYVSHIEKYSPPPSIHVHFSTYRFRSLSLRICGWSEVCIHWHSLSLFNSSLMPYLLYPSSVILSLCGDSVHPNTASCHCMTHTHTIHLTNDLSVTQMTSSVIWKRLFDLWPYI